MAITISGENNNDRILASDGVIDQISGINIVGLITASHINVGSNIQLGNAGIITATTFVGNLTGNVNSTSPLLLQTGGSERFRITSDNALGIAGANYGSSGQVLTSGGSGSAVTWTTITQGVTSDAQRNTVGGTNAGDSFTGTDATDNTIFGYNAGTSLTSGDKNVIIGAYAAASVTTVGNFVAIGNSAYSSQVSSNGGSVAIGHNALKTYTGSFSNVAIGQGAGQDMGSSGGQNTLVGDNAGYGCKGYNSVIIGFHAGSASNTQGGETIIGMQARYNGNNKAGNTAVGKEAMFGASGGNGSHTTAIGYEALKVLNNGGNQNTALGYQAGDKVNTGTSNVIIGYSAASTGTNDLTNGSNNIIIGKESAATSATVSNEVTIGDANITRFRIPGIGLDLTSAPPTLANGADNRVVTASSASALNGESTLTYDGTTLSNTNGGANFTKSANNYVLVGSTNASGASLVLDGDSNGDGSGTDYAYLTHNTDGDLDIVVDNPANAGNIKFFTNSSTERLRITSSGDVGIGYDSPTVKLHVREAASGASSYDNRYHIIMENDDEAYLGFYVPDNQYAGIRFHDTTGLEGYIDYYFGTDAMHYVSTDHHLFKTAGTERLRIGSSGQLGIAGANYGTSGQVFTSQGASSPIQWATLTTGKVLQMTYKRGGVTSSSNSGGWTDSVESGLNVDITPLSATSRIIIQMHSVGGNTSSGRSYFLRLRRKVNNTGDTNVASFQIGDGSNGGMQSMALTHVDYDSSSPFNTSHVRNYRIRFGQDGSGTARFDYATTSVLYCLEIQ